MPELPEVETIARGLANAVTGKTIDAVAISMAKIAVAAPGVDFAAALAGETIGAVGRRGKYVVIALGSGRRLAVHLRMTGRLIVHGAEYPEPYPYTHIVLRFTDGTRLSFADVRQFGRMRLLEAGDPWDADGGLEPLSEGFTSEAFVSMLDGRRTPIKAFLLDQSRIAGVGNIYACEALWEAGIRPSRPSHKISRPARRRLHGAVRSVLQRAIDARGTSVDDYVDAEGLKGGFQNQLAVYGRLGEPCPRCGKPIVRTVIGQRGTWWCRSCQK
ncbi:formamidopyrimidine-DNA glycosylase [Vulcanimicrobium alpinum]|uniref:Formamidopyrimidine-DNA glycosylase n=1 Tax=Vulcanimicrobium alpinum TaxID=3016050 RepID=A0AAN1XZ16_UNVUL|nr:bifunctional DNA-formamidopyrimidine glycosylase/DNA-(apurinic or apyrimidinic site) lyase [Vulcanimicrobium alpinum]BDE07996.1 formamidopyrimidine-DNA glycosylase [Vulcanimicrobium alpinum]